MKTKRSNFVFKGFISLVLRLILMMGIAMPIMANSVPGMESDISTSIFTKNLDMLSFDGIEIPGTGAYILHANGELWGYIAHRKSRSRDTYAL